MRKTGSVIIVLRMKVQEKKHKRSVTSLCPAGDQGQDVQAKPVMLGDFFFFLQERWENFKLKPKFLTYEID